MIVPAPRRHPGQQEAFAKPTLAKEKIARMGHPRWWWNELEKYMGEPPASYLKGVERQHSPDAKRRARRSPVDLRHQLA